MSGRKPWAALLLLLTIAAAQELLFRFVFPLPEVRDFNRVHYMPVGPAGKAVTAVRSIKMVVESSPDHVHVAESLNGYGFRDAPWTLRKPADEVRAVFVACGR